MEKVSSFMLYLLQRVSFSFSQFKWREREGKGCWGLFFFLFSLFSLFLTSFVFLTILASPQKNCKKLLVKSCQLVHKC